MNQAAFGTTLSDAVAECIHLRRPPTGLKRLTSSTTTFSGIRFSMKAIASCHTTSGPSSVWPTESDCPSRLSSKCRTAPFELDEWTTVTVGDYTVTWLVNEYLISDQQVGRG